MSPLVNDENSTVFTVPLYVWLMILGALGFFNEGAWVGGTLLLTLAVVAYIHFITPAKGSNAPAPDQSTASSDASADG